MTNNSTHAVLTKMPNMTKITLTVHPNMRQLSQYEQNTSSFMSLQEMTYLSILFYFRRKHILEKTWQEKFSAYPSVS